MDAVIGAGVEPRVAARIGEIGRELAVAARGQGGRLDIGDAERLHARGEEGVHRADVGVELRLAHLRQADPIDLDAALAHQVDDRGHPLGDDPLPALGHELVAAAVQIDALGVVGAVGNDRDVDRVAVQLGAGVVEQVEAAVAGEAGRPLGILPDLVAAVAAQDVVDPGPDAVAEAVAEHADPDRAPLAHRRREARGETVGNGRIGLRRR